MQENRSNDLNDENNENKIYDPSVSVERTYRDAIISIIRGDNERELLCELLDDYHYNDIAAVLPELESEERVRFFSTISSDMLSDILMFSDEPLIYFSEISEEKGKRIVNKMDADELSEILDAMPEDEREGILRLLEGDLLEDVELISSYDDEQFGRVMSTDFISVELGESVKGAMKALVRGAADTDNISTVFVTQGGKLYGAIELKELIRARSDEPLEEYINPNFPFVYGRERISENIERVREYAEELIPVLSRTRRLLGVITAQDLIEIVDEEYAEDYARLAALTDGEESEGLWASVKKRIPWLCALLVLGLLVSAVVGLFEGVVSALPFIVSFQSLILGMAGNVGTQSLAVTVRRLNSEPDKIKPWRFILGETAIGMTNGLLVGICSLAVVTAYLALTGTPFLTAALTAACVSLALCFAMTVAGFTGAGVPMLFSKLKIDPAVASGPLITTLNDLVAVVGYYTAAYLLLYNFVL